MCTIHCACTYITSTSLMRNIIYNSLWHIFQYSYHLREKLLTIICAPHKDSNAVVKAYRTLDKFPITNVCQGCTYVGPPTLFIYVLAKCPGFCRIVSKSRSPRNSRKYPRCLLNPLFDLQPIIIFRQHCLLHRSALYHMVISLSIILV